MAVPARRGWSSRCRPAIREGLDVAALAHRLGWRPVLAIVNGAIRELVYKEQVGESTADQISVAPLIALLASTSVLQRRWPLATTREALSMERHGPRCPVLFEFGFGHYVEGDSWADLLRTYDVTAENLWILIPLWIAAGPAVVRALAATRSA